MIENIPIVEFMDTTHWPKDMHLGYAKNVIRRINEECTQENPAPAKLEEQITPLKAAVGKEDADYDFLKDFLLILSVATPSNSK